MLKIPHMPYLFTLLMTGVLLSSMGASAQEAPAAPLRVGVVDIARVSNEYQALAEEDEKLKEWLSEKQRYRERLEGFAFLSQENFNEAVQILALARPLPEEKAARLTELEDMSAEKEKQFLELRANPERTAQQEEEFNSLREVAQARQEDLAELEQQIFAEYQQKVESAQNQLLQMVDEVITQYAQEQGYDLVLDRAWVFYGGEDITDRIIERLNQPPTGGEEAGEGTAAEPPPPAADRPPEDATEGGEE